MTLAKAAFQRAASARLAEIDRDQREAKEAINRALMQLRDKGYDASFCRSLLEGAIFYSPACSSGGVTNDR